MKLFREGVLGVSIGGVGGRMVSFFEDGKRFAMKLAMLTDCLGQPGRGECWEVSVDGVFANVRLILGINTKQRISKQASCKQKRSA